MKGMMFLWTSDTHKDTEVNPVRTNIPTNSWDHLLTIVDKQPQFQI